jgi:hypothetical protein
MAIFSSNFEALPCMIAASASSINTHCEAQASGHIYCLVHMSGVLQGVLQVTTSMSSYVIASMLTLSEDRWICQALGGLRSTKA